jgi:hypothetical protein
MHQLSKTMNVKFKFLTGDVDWSVHGGTWISQKFNNGDADFWLVREILNWEERGESVADGKYTVSLSTISPDTFGLDSQNLAIRCSFGDKTSWDELTEESRVEALYAYGCYIVEESWNGNNYSLLFKECQAFADSFVEGCEILPPVDFSKLPETILVVISKNRYGHLEGKPKSDRHLTAIAATNVHGNTSFYIQEDFNVDAFINDYLPVSKRKILDEGWDVTIRMSTSSFVLYLSESSDEYIEYLQEKDTRSRPQSLPSLFAEINGIPIYHVHKDGYGAGRETDFWYSTAQVPEDLHYECSFRVDELDPKCRVQPVGNEPPIESWNRFQEHCKRAIAQALRENKLKLAPAPDAAVLGGSQQPKSWDVVLGGQANH